MLNQQDSQLFQTQQGSYGRDYSLTAKKKKSGALPDLESATERCFYRLLRKREVLTGQLRVAALMQPK